MPTTLIRCEKCGDLHRADGACTPRPAISWRRLLLGLAGLAAVAVLLIILLAGCSAPGSNDTPSATPALAPLLESLIVETTPTTAPTSTPTPALFTGSQNSQNAAPAPPTGADLSDAWRRWANAHGYCWCEWVQGNPVLTGEACARELLDATRAALLCPARSTP